MIKKRYFFSDPNCHDFVGNIIIFPDLPTSKSELFCTAYNSIDYFYNAHFNVIEAKELQDIKNHIEIIKIYSPKEWMEYYKKIRILF